MATKTDVMLTTVDNPYNPFDDFDKWLNYDILKGYNCCGIVARIAPGVDMIDEDFDDDFRIQAIMRFVSEDPLHIYTAVSKEVETLSDNAA